jgi:hypothetical protein
MVKRCAICSDGIDEEYGKLGGTMLKVRNENGMNEFIYVCSLCQRTDNWIEKAKVRAV